MNMKSGGYKYQIESRSGNIALVSGTNKYGSKAWEIWKIRQTKKERMKFGKTIPAGSDIAPIPTDWGKYGWPCRNEEDARTKYREKLLQEDS